MQTSWRSRCGALGSSRSSASLHAAVPQKAAPARPQPSARRRAAPEANVPAAGVGGRVVAAPQPPKPQACASRAQHTVAAAAAAAVDEQQQRGSGSDGADASDHEQQQPHRSDPSPLCVVLPNGRHFQLQMVVRRGGSQPTWRFADVADALPLVVAPTTDPTEQQQQEQLDSAALEHQQQMPPAVQQQWQQLQLQQQPQPQQLFMEQQQQQQQQADATASEEASLPLTQLSAAARAAAAAAAHAAAAQSLPWSTQEAGLAPPLAPAPAAADEEEELMMMADEDSSSLESAHTLNALAAAAAAEAPPAAAAAEAVATDAAELLLPWALSDEAEADAAALQQPLQAAAAAAVAGMATDTQQQQQQQQQQQEQQDLRQQLERAFQMQGDAPDSSTRRGSGTGRQPASSAPDAPATADGGGMADASAAAAPRDEQRLLLAVQRCQSVPVMCFLLAVCDGRGAKGSAHRAAAPPPTGWTAAVTAAALDRLVQLLPWQMVAELKGSHSQQQQAADGSSTSAAGGWRGPLRDSLQAPAALAPAQQEQQQELGARSSTQQAPPPQQFRQAVRLYLRCVQLLEAQLGQAPAGALVAAAKLAARLIGSSCASPQWWQATRGYTVLAEAAGRMEAGTLGVADAIQLCYSYSHASYSPVALLRPLTQLVLAQPHKLRGLPKPMQTLSQFTYCVTSCLADLAPQLDGPRLAAAVLHALDQPGVEGDGRAYDLAMLLRHMCQLSPEPPAGCEEHLLPALVGRMPCMSAQELATVLHVAAEWRLPQREALAAAAAQLVAAAAAQQQGGGGHPAAEGGDDDEPPLPLVLLVERSARLRTRLQQQLLPARQAARDAAAAAQGTDGAAAAEQAYQAARVDARATLKHLQCTERFVAAWRAALYGPEGGGAGQQGAPSQQQQQRRRQPRSQLLPRSGTDAVILLHRFCCCGFKPSGALLTFLLHKAARELHAISLLQANLLRRALVYRWVDGSACAFVLDTCLRQWMQPSITSTSSSSQDAATAAAATLAPRLFKLPYWQLKALIVAAGRLGPLAAEVGEQQQQQGGQAPPAATDDQDGSGGEATAAAFVGAILRSLTPPVLAGWRADMVVALWWAAARLRLHVPPELLSAGGHALMAGMRHHVAARELPHLVWASAVLQVQDQPFLRALCGRMMDCATQLPPASIATAAWALAQLRCPNTAVLDALSRELLRPEAWAPSCAVLHAKTWQRPLAAAAQHAPLAAAQHAPAQDGWGSLQRPLPRSTASTGSHVGGAAARWGVLAAHPRVLHLASGDVAKLAASCCRAGWAPPQLFTVLAARAMELMPDMTAEHLSQLMWAFATANCRDVSLLLAAAERAAVLARGGAFTCSRQPLGVLGAFRSLGFHATVADAGLAAEVARLRAVEAGGDAAGTDGGVSTSADADTVAAVAAAMQPCAV